jgi:hypothetical protein
MFAHKRKLIASFYCKYGVQAELRSKRLKVEGSQLNPTNLEKKKKKKITKKQSRWQHIQNFTKRKIKQGKSKQIKYLKFLEVLPQIILTSKL